MNNTAKKTSLRIYKRWDRDLLYLFAKGYNVTELVERALHAHVYDEKLRIVIDTIEYFDPEELRSVHFALYTEDTSECAFLQSIQAGCRSACVKDILRHAIVTPMDFVYLKEGDALNNARKALEDINIDAPDVYVPRRTENRANVLSAFRRAAAAATAKPAADQPEPYTPSVPDPANMFEV